jgi:hypothetical protein
MFTPNSQLILLLAVFTLLITGVVLWLTGQTETKVGDNVVADARNRREKNPKENFPFIQEVYGYLMEHIDNNIKQNKNVFRLTIVIIIAGFFMIAYGIIGLGDMSDDSLPAQSLPAVIAGVLTEFIAATILFVYQSVFRQTENYFRALERLTAIGMAIRILDDITDDPTNAELKSTTKASVAKLLIQLQHTNVIMENPDKEHHTSPEKRTPQETKK